MNRKAEGSALLFNPAAVVVRSCVLVDEKQKAIQ
jgi:hypothetical protein